MGKIHWQESHIIMRIFEKEKSESSLRATYDQESTSYHARARAHSNANNAHALRFIDPAAFATFNLCHLKAEGTDVLSSAQVDIHGMENEDGRVMRTSTLFHLAGFFLKETRIFIVRNFSHNSSKSDIAIK